MEALLSLLSLGSLLGLGTLIGVAGFRRLIEKDRIVVRKLRESCCKFHSWQAKKGTLSCSRCGKIPGRNDDDLDPQDPAFKDPMPF